MTKENAYDEGYDEGYATAAYGYSYDADNDAIPENCDGSYRNGYGVGWRAWHAEQDEWRSA